MIDYVTLLFRIEAGLLAFVLAFYGLFARERKAPYVVHKVYDEIGLILGAVLLTLALEASAGGAETLEHSLGVAASVLVLLAILFTTKRVYSIANRDLRLRDDKWWLATPIVRQLRTAVRSWKKKEVPVTVATSAALRDAIARAKWAGSHELEESAERADEWGPKLGFTFALFFGSFRVADRRLMELVYAFLVNGAYVLYIPCGRHPTELLLKLVRHCKDGGDDWMRFAARLIVVDAYTPHFGFGESIHEARRERIQQELGVQVVVSPPTYAGIHSATARVFRRIQKREDLLHPTLLVFENTYALVDLESPEEYRRFWRHVIPSERMLGSMYTVVAEQEVDRDSRLLLENYADVCHRDKAWVLGSDRGKSG